MARHRRRGRPKLKRTERKAYIERRRFFDKGHKTALKLFIWKEEDMSPEGLSHFPVKSRIYIKRKVLRPLDRYDVPVEYLETKEKIGQFILNQYGYPGTFIIRGFSGGSTKTRCKQVRLAKVIIFRVGEELRFNISDYSRLSRYWFYKGEK